MKKIILSVLVLLVIGFASADVFMLEPAVGVANPAATYCHELGYKYEVRDGSFCVFPEGECPGWQFYYGKCGQEHSYCAKQGYDIVTKDDGDAFSKEYAVCLKNGKEIGTVAELSGISEKAVKAKVRPLVIANMQSIPTQAPSSFDWRDYDGRDWITDVKDQGDCGSCWSFAVIALVEAMYQIRSQMTYVSFDLSEQEMITECLLNNNCCGGSITQALSYVDNYGISKEACMPYTDATCTCTDDTCDDTCAHNSGGHCSNSYCLRCEPDLTWIDEHGFVGSGPANMKDHISQHGPVVTYMGIGNEFEGDFFGDIYRCNDDSGYNHAVLIVGYDDVGQYWIVKNSYGTDWPDTGAGGYFKVGYGECHIEVYPYYGDIDYVCGAAITEDIVMQRDLDCTGTALYVEANDITIDCNDHLIEVLEGFGVQSYDYDGITIKNCVIDSYDAFRLENGQNITVQNNTIIDGSSECRYCDRLVVKDNVFGVTGIGSMMILRGNNAIIENNEFRSSYSESSLRIYNSVNNSIVNNTFSGEGEGIHVGGSSSNNYAWNNQFIGVTAYDGVGNYWDYNEVGNYWSDFSSNSGYPWQYYIYDYGVDHYPVGYCVDLDGDSYSPYLNVNCPYSELDCNDYNELANPGMMELCRTSFDDDCDGEVNEDCEPGRGSPVFKKPVIRI